MLPHEGYFLNITALKTTLQPSNDKCILHCIDTTDCFSINAVQQANNTVQCQLLSGNKHRNSTEYVTLTGSTHFYIPVSTLKKLFYISLVFCENNVYTYIFFLFQRRSNIT